MSLRAGLWAVQIQSSHDAAPSRSGLVGLTILVVGLGLITYGTVGMLRKRQWRAAAFPARGRVVDNLPQPTRRGKTLWRPLIEFEANGSVVRFACPGAPAPQGWPLGGDIDVLYDPGDPNRAGLADSGGLISWALLAGLAVLGLSLAVAV